MIEELTTNRTKYNSSIKHDEQDPAKVSLSSLVLSSSSSLVLSSSSSTTIATLDGNTLWEIKLLLRKENLPSYSVSAILRVRFLESINFEPPQGYVLVEDDLNGLVKVNEKNLTSTFKLSEDINDR